MYPAIGEHHLRYFAKWGLIQPVMRTSSEAYYSFQDLLVVKQASAELERGTSFRAVLRALVASRAGQLTFDFRPMRTDAQPAKVIALERRTTAAPPRVRLVPGTPGPTQRSLAARYFLDGSALDDGEVSKQEAAMAAYRRALSLDPGLVPALVNLANVHYARDEAIEAQALYERAIGIDADCFEARFNLGNIFHDMSQYDEAQACYREAIALNPSYADAHFYLAVTLEKMGRSADAKPYWRTYQELAPDGEWVELAKEFSD
jgi:tetratricopeptide (TPR) repeat protein